MRWDRKIRLASTEPLLCFVNPWPDSDDGFLFPSHLELIPLGVTVKGKEEEKDKVNKF